MPVKLADCEFESWIDLIILIWHSMSVIWFAVPLCQYLASPFYQTDVWHFICAVAICAAMPLSWHISFLAIPSSAAPLFCLVTGVSREAMITLHARIALSSIFWASLHVAGEVVYLISQSLFTSSLSLENPWDDGMIFVCGVITASIFMLLAVVALFRKHSAIKARFRQSHRLLAAAMLLAASSHWWPFVFFLSPAVALAAVGQAMRCTDCITGGHRAPSLALFFSVCAAAAAITATWSFRQWFMLKYTADFSTPFVFPPVALAAAYALSRTVSSIVLRFSGSKDPLDYHDDTTSALLDVQH